MEDEDEDEDEDRQYHVRCSWGKVSERAGRGGATLFRRTTNVKRPVKLSIRTTQFFL
jgi:hypothetical protein